MLGDPFQGQTHFFPLCHPSGRDWPSSWSNRILSRDAAERQVF